MMGSGNENVGNGPFTLNSSQNKYSVGLQNLIQAHHVLSKPWHKMYFRI